MKISSYERVVMKLLRADKIEFKREVEIADLRNGKYRFDFYLPSRNCFIEVQGEQHYEFTPAFFKDRSEFLKAQERDRQKIQYALAHKTPLYCIPYWEIAGLTSAADLFNPDFLARNKFHNDEVYRNQKNKSKQ